MQELDHSRLHRAVFGDAVMAFADLNNAAITDYLFEELQVGKVILRRGRCCWWQANGVVMLSEPGDPPRIVGLQRHRARGEREGHASEEYAARHGRHKINANRTPPPEDVTIHCTAYGSDGRVKVSRRTLVRIVMVVAAGLAVVATVDYWRDRQIREALHSALTPVEITNCQLQRFGSTNDGGYLMCANLLKPSQSAYSYGIDGTDDWGCGVAGPLQIPLHQYECFNTTAPTCREVAPRFHAECVGPAAATIDGRPFDTIANHIVKNGDTGKRLVMKMDVEGSEWASLLAAPDHVLEAIDQLAIEFHRIEDRAYLDTINRLKQFFYVAHYHHNNYECLSGFDPFAGPVFEVLMVNKRIAVANPWVTAWQSSPLDAPNDPQRADCQDEPERSEPARIARWIGRKTRGVLQLLRVNN